MPIDSRRQDKPPDEMDRWDLGELYPGDAAWEEARRAFVSRLDRVAEHRGRLGESPAVLLAALSLISSLAQEYRRLSSYAHMQRDLDTRESSAQAMAQASELAGTRLEAAVSFLAPEILALPEGTVAAFLDREPRLAPHAHDLDDILRRRNHTLSPAEEKLLADSGAMAGAAENLYGVLANADLPWPTVTLSTGEQARLDPSSFAKHRTAANRDDRLAVFRAFFGAWQAYSRTFGVALDAEVRKNIFYARSRGYTSALEASLDRNKVPTTVYDAVIAAATEGLPSLHRYLRVRKQVLGLDQLCYHDIHPPLVPSMARTYGVAEAKRLVLEAAAPLGRDYVATLEKGYSGRWLDLLPSIGKRSGAYSNGSVYEEHPFILMNFNGNFDAVATLAHESGHAMHSHLANRAQPFESSGYSIFVAEVASTFNEALLYRRLMEDARTDEVKLFLLSSWLDAMRGTFFRQAMFSEFERAIYEEAEKGETLTSEALGSIYLRLLRKYCGEGEGVSSVDELYAVEWAYIPHFYANFYVFQYATGFAASTSLAHRVITGVPDAAKAFLGFLSAGGSDYPYELLRATGVDLAMPAPYRDTIAEMGRAMDAIEAILAKKEPAGRAE